MHWANLPQTNAMGRPGVPLLQILVTFRFRCRRRLVPVGLWTLQYFDFIQNFQRNLAVPMTRQFHECFHSAKELPTCLSECVDASVHLSLRLRRIFELCDSRDLACVASSFEQCIRIGSPREGLVLPLQRIDLSPFLKDTVSLFETFSIADSLGELRMCAWILPDVWFHIVPKFGLMVFEMGLRCKHLWAHKLEKGPCNQNQEYEPFLLSGCTVCLTFLSTSCLQRAFVTLSKSLALRRNSFLMNER